MIQSHQSSAANYLSAVTSGHGSTLRQISESGTDFASILNGTGQTSAGNRYSDSAQLLNQLQSLAVGSGASETAIASGGKDDPTHIAESTMNGRLPEEEPQSAEEALQQFVGETFYGLLMKQMRDTVIKSDLMGNSQAEKMFESQFDQMMVQSMADNSSEQLAKPMYEQMMRFNAEA